MPYYDCVSYHSDELVSYEKTACFGEIFTGIERYKRVSVLAFPEGGLQKNGNLGKEVMYRYGREDTGALLQKFDTQEKSGVERWAEFLGSFIPGTSFIYEYDEKKSLQGELVPMCEFRLEAKAPESLSRIMRQIWITSIRYAWEKPMTKIPDFCLEYWKPDMKQEEAFNILLLAHEIRDVYTNHTLVATNPKFFNKEKYQELLTVKASITGYGTGFLSQGSYRERDRNYIPTTKLYKAVQKAWENIENKRELVPYEQLFEIWQENITAN